MYCTYVQMNSTITDNLVAETRLHAQARAERRSISRFYLSQLEIVSVEACIAIWGFELGLAWLRGTCQERIRASVQAARVRMPDIRTYRALLCHTKVRMFMNLHNYRTIQNSVITYVVMYGGHTYVHTYVTTYLTPYSVQLHLMKI